MKKSFNKYNKSNRVDDNFIEKTDVVSDDVEEINDVEVILLTTEKYQVRDIHEDKIIINKDGLSYPVFAKCSCELSKVKDKLIGQYIEIEHDGQFGNVKIIIK